MKVFSKAHGNRSAKLQNVDNLEQLFQLFKQGYSIYKADILVKYPERYLSDLSNLPYLLSCCSIEKVLKFHELVQQLIEETDFLNVFQVRGNGLYPEIVISGENKEHLEKIAEELERQVLTHMTLDQKYTLFMGRGINNTQAIEAASENTRHFYNALKVKLKRFFLPECYNYLPVLNCNIIYHNHVIWDKLAQLAKNKLFILTAGLSLSLGFYNQVQDEAIYYLDIHRENDAFQLFKKRESIALLPASSSLYDSWVIIDKVYTGKTIVEAEKVLRKQYGDCCQIIKVGLFPKSYPALKNLDYIVYAGRLFKVNEILQHLTAANWHKELLYLDRLSY